MSQFGERLRKAFGNAKDAEIARKLGITQSAVKNYVEGRIPDAERLLQIRNLTNCDLDWLLTGEEKPVAVRREEQVDLDKTFRGVIKSMIDEELTERMITLQGAQDLGTVDDFDIEAAVRKYDNAIPVLQEWYQHDGLTSPQFQALAFAGWDKMSLEEKVKEIRAVRGIVDRQQYRKKNVSPKTS